MTHTATEIHLARRPEGWPVPEDFTTVTTDLPEPGPGQVLIRNRFISVDPYMRGKMNDVPSYTPPYQLNTPMDGGAIGVVEASGAENIAVGRTVLHQGGWRDRALLDATEVRVVDEAQVSSLSAYLNGLGMTGLTAYTGLLDVANFKPGDTVFVSGAAGAVGQMVGQIAKLKGAKRVIGSAGSTEKVTYLTERLGFDTAFNYKDGPVSEQLKAAAPDGIDVYFDNVGGDHLEAAISSMNVNGRIAICGAISQYNATTPPTAPRNLALFIGKRITMTGFLVLDRFDRMKDFIADIAPHLASGKIVTEETIVDGIDNTVNAFLGMLRGENVGKMLVRV
ncbi:NADP-dependent oxidoreductase [Stackebrandtia nassauensis]|uniref:Alcohol dehydrogenase zinc-binding domain protein n=1 Tax=Stackebrandtia nassauensis (strain DSM 44728 / CIP 108903 / NRRL B-16338 / NBRC 102104 / LLR-40K-21) TaxID=446470 RepID=D3PUT7_STANL|nr:NADP-dependent oxidoreductase [Stackebrandtia nassauensis]ADD44961.1 Alcohol dehydrogenase zinc-binding domain protein [Stackebrandtia nassauensis DSM 44728]